MPMRLVTHRDSVNNKPTRNVTVLEFTPRDSRPKPDVIGRMTAFQYDRKAAYGRLCQALKTRHGIDLSGTEYGSRKAAATLLGVGESRLGNWAARGLPIEATPLVAAAAKIDVYFLLGQTPHIGGFGKPATSDLQDHLLNELASIQKKLEPSR